MTPDTLYAILQTLRWSTTDLAHALSADERRVRRWKAGKYPVPAKVAQWLMDLATTHSCHPAPRDWGTAPHSAVGLNSGTCQTCCHWAVFANRDGAGSCSVLLKHPGRGPWRTAPSHLCKIGCWSPAVGATGQDSVHPDPQQQRVVRAALRRSARIVSPSNPPGAVVEGEAP